MAAAFGLLYLLVALGLDRYGQRAVSGHYDAIVVAGCRVMASGRPSPALAQRVRRAVALYEEGRAETLGCTGGVGDHPPSEASAAADFAEELGVPRHAMVLEERSTSTDENARFAHEAIGDGRVLVVTSAYHVFRCERVFGRYFDAVDGAGALEAFSPRTRGALREVFATVAYALLGRL
ncbi:MAG: YdcF family protein [Myxococcota bacterium]